MIEKRFSITIKDALEEKLQSWEDTETGYLALIIVLDQFTRNVFRDTLRAFAGDNKALVLSQKCCDKEYLKNTDVNRSKFMLMPMLNNLLQQVKE